MVSFSMLAESPFFTRRDIADTEAFGNRRHRFPAA